MSRAIQERLHRQHRAWQDDHTMWRGDIDEWHEELRTATAVLKEVQDMLHDSREALEIHADTIWESEQRVRAHERALSQESMAGARRRTDKQWLTMHRQEARRHERAADAHKRIKRHHHGLVAKVKRLLAKAREAM